MKKELLYNSFERLSDFPIDPSGIFRLKIDRDEYVKNDPIAYDGQLLVVFGDTDENNGFSIISSTIDEETGIRKVLEFPSLSFFKNLQANVTSIQEDFTDISDANKTFVNKINDDFITLETELKDKITNELTTTTNTILNSFDKKIDDIIPISYADLKKKIADIESLHKTLKEIVEDNDNELLNGIDQVLEFSFSNTSKSSPINFNGYFIKDIIVTVENPSKDIISTPLCLKTKLGKYINLAEKDEIAFNFANTSFLFEINEDITFDTVSIGFFESISTATGRMKIVYKMQDKRGGN